MAEASVVLGVMASYYTGYLLTKYVGDFYVFVLTTSASTLAFLYIGWNASIEDSII